jgi:hypothetical protein
MRISTKHQGQQTVRYSDFSGGLNSSFLENMIADNELFNVINMEIDPNTRLLRTVKGTESLCTIPVNIKSAAYDVLNQTFYLFADNKSIYATSDFSTIKNIGTLTGDGYVIATLWEDGMIISSGGKLQYAKGLTDVTTITTSPDHCRGAYVRSGRVITFDDTDTVLYSGVGDETNWTQDSNDPARSLFAQIGYKVGGKIIGMVNLSKDILFIKDNGMVFRLENEYPDWSISELGRNIYCKSATSYCNIGDAVIILGNGILQNVTTTQEYGDMKPQNMGTKVTRELNSLPPDTKLRFIPSINQLWFIGHDHYVLIFDCSAGAFFQRSFNSPVVDVVSIDNNVYIVKKTSICRLVDDFKDDGKDLEFMAVFKTMLSQNELLVKKIDMGFTPFMTAYNDAKSYLHVGYLTLPFPNRKTGNTKILVDMGTSAEISDSTELHNSNDSVFLDFEHVTPSDIVMLRTRAICRSTRIRSYITGSGFPFILNYVGFDVVEV